MGGNQKKRIDYIDVAKGILISLVLYDHTYVLSKIMGLHDVTLIEIHNTYGLFDSYFMQSFFLITGFCSSFNTPIFKYIWKNIKTIILPGFLLTLIGDYLYDIISGHSININHLVSLMSWFSTGGQWFIVALFWAKICYWFLSKYNIKVQAIAIAFLYIVGLFLNRYEFVSNYMWHRHMFLMLPYLFIGHQLKAYKGYMWENITFLAKIAVILIPLQTILHVYTSYSMPMQDYFICVDFATFPIHFVNICLGTSLVLYIAKTVSRSNVLITLGKGSLLIYLLNEGVHKSILYFIIPFYSEDWQIVFHVISFALCMGTFYLIVQIVYSTKYLNWIVGKC